MSRFRLSVVVLLLLLSLGAAYAAPSITSLTPNSGAVGASVTIAGSGFGSTQGTSTVKFNGVTATVTSWASASITATVPTGATTGNVVVTVSGAASNGVSFTVVAAPGITSLSPTSGAVGASVTVTGTSFGASQGSSTIKFNGTLATPSSWSATRIVVPVPSGATTGNVVVHASGVDSNGSSFTVLPTPGITSLAPTSGAVGATVTITGTNFGATQGASTVKFNGTIATATSWSATSIVATVPAGATTGNVVVTVSGVASNGSSFTVAAAPSISSLSPTSGPSGASVTITGANFGATQGSSTVKFNGTAATPSSWSATSIKAPVPAGATTGNVVVHASGVDSNGSAFTVIPAPTISSLSPTSGAVGAAVTITGTNFGAAQGSSTIKFNGTAATATSWSAASIVTTVPAGATTGSVVVAVSGVASNNVTFTVVSAPSITSLSPASGSAGTSVTITGTNFGTTQGSSTVKFNGTTGTPTSWSATSIKVPVPAGTMTGNVVVHAGGVDSNAKPFTITLGSFSLTSGNLVHGRDQHTATQLNNGKVLLVAGLGSASTSSSSFLAIAELYDPATGTFAPTGSLNLGRTAHAAALLNNGQVLVAGGQDVNFNITNSVELYDSATGVFTTTGALVTARRQLTATVLTSGLVLIAGGQDASGNAQASSELYNPATGTFAATGTMNTARHGHTATLLNDGRVLMAGGLNSSGSALTSAEVYDPIAGTFTTVGSLTNARGDHTATLLNSGKVLIVGGDSSAATAGPSELYDPGTGAFSITGSLTTPRSSHAAVLLSNGMVLVAGGSPFTGTTLPKNSELYDPATGTFLTGASLNTGRQNTTATLLNNGTVMIASGADNTNTPITTAELYQPVSQTPPGLSSISVTPSGQTILTGTVQRLTATGTFSDNSTQTLSSGTWSSSSPAVATVSSDAGNYGHAFGVASGTATISACAGPVCGSATVNVVTLSITNVTPASGSVGSSVTITGTGFGATQGSSSVTFNGVVATPTAWSPTSVTVPVPAAATTGNIIVSAQGKTSNGFLFTVQPLISLLTPVSTLRGSNVTISGSGFGLIQGSSTVTFNGAPAAVTSWSFTSIVATVPLAASTGNVVVTVSGSASNGVLFTMPLVITALSAYSGNPGASITISGNDFGDSAGAVTFNGTPATVSSWTNSSIAAFVPNGASSGNIVLSNGGFSSNGVPFTVGPIVYANERTITIDHTKVPNSDQVNFPVLVSGTFNYLATTSNGGKVQNINGYDIIFTSDAAGNNKLDHEIESYNPATGTVAFWVRVPLLSHSGDTVIFMRYGSPVVISSQENKPGVWDSNYQMVLHLGESTPPYRDSTSNAYVSSGGTPPGQIAGQIGSGQFFNSAASQSISFSPAQSPNPTADITIETWIHTNQTPQGQTGIVSKVGAADFSFSLQVGSSAEALFSSVSNEQVNIGGAGVLNDNVWHHLAVSAPSTGNIVLYRDGVPDASLGNFSPLLAHSAAPLVIGTGFGGTLDEVRISNTARSGDWIAAEYNNQSSPATFLAYGLENAPAISSVNPPSGEPGTVITITGSGFTSTPGTTTLNGEALSISSWSPTSVVAVVPSDANTGQVIVTAGGTQTNGVSFTVLLPAISSLSPNFGDPGAAVVIGGSYFGVNQGTVSFNGIAATVTSWSDNSVSVQVPIGSVAGNLVVTSTAGRVSNGVQFSTTDDLAITLMSPGNGPAGTSVTLTGGGFGATQGQGVIMLDGAPMIVSSWSENQITAIVPAGAATGVITVNLPGNVPARSPAQFQVTTTVQLTDSFGRTTSYQSGMTGGTWQSQVATGSGCSSCTVRGNVQSSQDSTGNLLTQTDELGRVTTYTYDANNNVASQSVQINANTAVTTSYTYNTFGEPLTVTDPLGNTTTNTYDGNGNLLTVTTSAPDSSTAASVTQFAYDNKGEMTQIADPLNHVTTLTYNSAGLIATITDAQQNVTSYQYDSHSNRTAVIDALQHQTSFAYDAMDRLTGITFPDQSTESFGYDSRGRRTSVTDQNGKVTAYAYDDADRLISVTDANNGVTQYAYDTENSLLSITDANSHTTSFTYDASGRVTQTTFPSTLAETYNYDATGNLISRTDRKNQTILYVYDALNRLTHKGYPDSTGVDYIYDLAGKIKQGSDPTGTYGFAYDNMGRLIGTTTHYSFLPGATFTNSYGYDAASNRTSFTAPDGNTSTYQYDSLSRVTNLTNSLTGQFTFGYDTLSRKTSLTRPSGVNTGYNYDSVSRLLSVLHQSGTNTLDGASYTYDSAGNRLSKGNLLNGVTEQYTYDPLYQLKQVTQGTTTTESYTYDPAGNRLSSLGVSSYNYNASNQLTSTSAATFTYDNNGNTLSKITPSGTQTYTWDFENRLVSVALTGSTGTVTFQYDPFGRRIQKRSSGGTTIYLYDGDNSIEEVDAVGNNTARYIQGIDIDEPLAEQRAGAVGYYELDGLGSVTSLVGSTGMLANSYTYDVFGNLIASTGSFGNSFQYAGRDYDPETGLRYYRARYYSSDIGRFISEDPILFVGSDNFYTYVDNDPVNITDPSGMCPPQNLEKPCPAVLPRDPRRRTMVDTLMGEMTWQGRVGTAQWPDSSYGPIADLRFWSKALQTFGYDAPSGPIITNATLDQEAALMAGTILNLGHIGNATTYLGLPNGQHNTTEALKSRTRSPLCMMLLRAINAVNSPAHVPFGQWRGNEQDGYLRRLNRNGPAVRVAGTDFY